LPVAHLSYEPSPMDQAPSRVEVEHGGDQYPSPSRAALFNRLKSRNNVEVGPGGVMWGKRGSVRMGRGALGEVKRDRKAPRRMCGQNNYL
jgi:hypothetical protein